MIRSPLLVGGGPASLEGELSPPLVEGFTSLPPSSFNSLKTFERGEGPQDPLDLLSEASALFARVAKSDPTLLRTVLELGHAIAKTMGADSEPVPELFGPRPPMGGAGMPPGMPGMPPGMGGPPLAPSVGAMMGGPPMGPPGLPGLPPGLPPGMGMPPAAGGPPGRPPGMPPPGLPPPPPMHR